MIEVIAIDGAAVSMAGDFYETLIYATQPGNIVEFIERSFRCDEITYRKGKSNFVEIKSNQFLPAGLCEEILAMDEVLFIKKLSPVLPRMVRAPWKFRHYAGAGKSACGRFPSAGRPRWD